MDGKIEDVLYFTVNKLNFGEGFNLGMKCALLICIVHISSVAIALGSGVVPRGWGRGGKSPPKGSKKKKKERKKEKERKWVFSCIKVVAFFFVIFDEEIHALEGLLSQF